MRGVSDAAAEGDRSENAEYIYGKKRLREIDRKLKHLGQAQGAQGAFPACQARIGRFRLLGQLRDEDGAGRCYQLVGPDEFDVSSGRISIDSPVGQALLGKRIDDEVTISRPNGDLTAYITAIGNERPAL